MFKIKFNLKIFLLTFNVYCVHLYKANEKCLYIPGRQCVTRQCHETVSRDSVSREKCDVLVKSCVAVHYSILFTVDLNNKPRTVFTFYEPQPNNYIF